MKYKISTKCCWFRGGSMIVKMYFINGMPFTFDELPDGHLRDVDLIKEADESRTFDDADMYQYYSYLVEEELKQQIRTEIEVQLLETKTGGVVRAK